jgi:hypothetical protein
LTSFSSFGLSVGPPAGDGGRDCRPVLADAGGNEANPVIEVALPARPAFQQGERVAEAVQALKFPARPDVARSSPAPQTLGSAQAVDVALDLERRTTSMRLTASSAIGIITADRPRLTFLAISASSKKYLLE